jgi:hypothetical protein
MNPALIKHFKLSEADIAQIQAALQPNQTLLDVLFEKKLVDPAAYLWWAKEHYSLPVLKIEFLNQTNNVEALLDRYKNVFPKNIIPFHEVDGVLYVMCLEPTPFEAPQTIQYVLAPYEVISKYASKYLTNAIATEEPKVEIPEEKENTNPLFKNLDTTKNPLESFSFDNLTTGEDAKPPTPEGDASDVGAIQLEDKEDVPAGLDFPTTPERENDSFVTNNTVKAVDLDSFSFVGVVPVNEEQKETSTQAPPAAQTPPPAEAQPAIAAPAPAAEAPAIIKPKPVKVDTSKPFTPATASSLAAKHPPKPKVVAAELPASVTPIVSPAAMAASAKEFSQFDEVLKSMKKYFDQSMMLLFNNGNLEPRAWDETWAKVAHAQNAIDVSTPSIFRIVNETLNPYHGYVVPNPINESFFTNWNKGQYPEHVTICPIVHDKKIYGMILGATSKAGAKKYQLHHIQEIANEAFTTLNNLSKAA